MSLTVRADVDLDDVMDEIDTDDLVKELKRRGKREPIDLFVESLDEVRDAIREGRSDDALMLMERFSKPRFKNTLECEERYKITMRESRQQ